MPGPDGCGNGDGGPVGPRAAWRDLVEDMRLTRGTQFLRVSRKMLNHLCSIGLEDAQAMLAEVEGHDGPSDGAEARGANVPGAKVRLEDSPLMSGLAAR